MMGARLPRRAPARDDLDPGCRRRPQESVVTPAFKRSGYDMNAALTHDTMSTTPAEVFSVLPHIAELWCDRPAGTMRLETALVRSAPGVIR